MPEVSKHTTNTPGWIDIGTDVEGAKAFYTALFGWSTAVIFEVLRRTMALASRARPSIDP